MIPNLIPNDPTANAETQRVSYQQAVLTVSGPSQYNPSEQIGFQEIQGFWKLPDSLISAMRVPPPGSIVLAQLTTKPKPPGPNTKAGSKYLDIDSIVSAPEGSVPIPSQQAQQPAPPQQQAPPADWPQTADEPVSGFSVDQKVPTGEEWHGDGLTVDEKIKKSQAVNLLFNTLNYPMVPEERVSLVKDMGFESTMEARRVAGEAWQKLRDGETPFTSEPQPGRPEPTHESGMAPPEEPDGWGRGEQIPGWDD